MPIAAPLAPLPPDLPEGDEDDRRAYGPVPGIALAIASAVGLASLALALLARASAWPLAAWALALLLTYAWVRAAMGFLRVRKAVRALRPRYQYAVHASFLAALQLLDLVVLGGGPGSIAPAPPSWPARLVALLAGGPLGAAAGKLALARLALAEAAICGLMAGKVVEGSYLASARHLAAMLAIAILWALVALPGTIW